MTRKRFIANVLGVTALFGAIAVAQFPSVNIDPHRHGNLSVAQNYIAQAFDRINDAQRANDSRLGGHAQRAKDLLSQANEELRLAADNANENEGEQ